LKERAGTPKSRKGVDYLAQAPAPWWLPGISFACAAQVGAVQEAAELMRATISVLNSHDLRKWTASSKEAIQIGVVAIAKQHRPAVAAGIMDLFRVFG